VNNLWKFVLKTAFTNTTGAGQITLFFALNCKVTC